MFETLLFDAQETLEILKERVDSLKGEYINFTVATKASSKTKPTPFEGSFKYFMMSCLKS